MARTLFISCLGAFLFGGSSGETCNNSDAANMLQMLRTSTNVSLENLDKAASHKTSLQIVCTTALVYLRSPIAPLEDRPRRFIEDRPTESTATIWREDFSKIGSGSYQKMTLQKVADNQYHIISHRDHKLGSDLVWAASASPSDRYTWEILHPKVFDIEIDVVRLRNIETAQYLTASDEWTLEMRDYWNIHKQLWRVAEATDLPLQYPGCLPYTVMITHDGWDRDGEKLHYQSRQLQDNNGNAYYHPNAKSWERWTVSTKIVSSRATWTFRSHRGSPLRINRRRAIRLTGGSTEMQYLRVEVSRRRVGRVRIVGTGSKYGGDMLQRSSKNGVSESRRRASYWRMQHRLLHPELFDFRNNLDESLLADAAVRVSRARRLVGSEPNDPIYSKWCKTFCSWYTDTRPSDHIDWFKTDGVDVSEHLGVCLVVYTTTNDIADYLADIDGWPVHIGDYNDVKMPRGLVWECERWMTEDEEEWTSFRSQIKNKCWKVVTAGHSLSGAMAGFHYYAQGKYSDITWVGKFDWLHQVDALYSMGPIGGFGDYGKVTAKGMLFITRDTEKECIDYALNWPVGNWGPPKMKNWRIDIKDNNKISGGWTPSSWPPSICGVHRFIGDDLHAPFEIYFEPIWRDYRLVNVNRAYYSGIVT